MRKTFASFRHRNYRYFFAGQFISLVGTWMQNVAQGWLVYDISHSSVALGVVNFLTALPVTALSLFGGVVADRLNKRSILVTSQVVAMLLAFVLAGLVYFKLVTVWQIALLGLVYGITNAFEIPARQSFVIELVGKDSLQNAIALNSSMFHSARACGPALAGVLIGMVGVAGCFFINGISYMAAIAGYLAIRLPVAAARTESQPLGRATLEALHYVRSEPLLRTVLFMTALTSLLAMPYSVLMPVFARDILGSGASGLGYLLAFNGAGAFVGAIVIASAPLPEKPLRRYFGGVLGFCLLILVFAFSRWFWLSALALAGIGFCLLMAFATANAAIQTQSRDELRGRVMGMYATAFLGLTPFGGMLLGAMATWIGAPLAVAVGPTVCAVVALIMMTSRRTSR
jgi:MFS family permease